MSKIVVNRCYGGFGLSHEAVMLYAEKAGFKLYKQETAYSFPNYWKRPIDELPEFLEGDAWTNATLKQRRKNNELYSECRFYDRDLKRDDPILVEVVETLGEKANGQFAKLDVAVVPDDVNWKIEEYDGSEWVSEVHRTW